MGEASPRAIALVIERGTLERGKLRVFPLTLCLLPLWNVDMMCWGSSYLSVFEMIATGWQNRKMKVTCAPAGIWYVAARTVIFGTLGKVTITYSPMPS